MEQVWLPDDAGRLGRVVWPGLHALRRVPRRFPIIDRVAELVGPETLRITDDSSRWPAEAELAVEGDIVPVALYLGTVGQGGRDSRVEKERRFQNPLGGRPISNHRPHRQALLLGLWEQDTHIEVTRPLLVSADPVRREGKTTRFSVFVGVENLRAALVGGWWEAANKEGELVRCFAPELLPASYSATTAGATPPILAMQAAISGSGLLDAEPPEVSAASERARRAATTLVRDARFAGRVLDAYDHRCAMCGLGAGLVQAAHIYPASAPGSPDEPWNGLALCANHHLAFDRDLIVVDPDTMKFSPSRGLLEEGLTNTAVARFNMSALGKLTPPRYRSAAPRRDMFVRRYELSSVRADEPR